MRAELGTFGEVLGELGARGGARGRAGSEGNDGCEGGGAWGAFAEKRGRRQRQRDFTTDERGRIERAKNYFRQKKSETTRGKCGVCVPAVANKGMKARVESMFCVGLGKTKKRLKKKGEIAFRVPLV